MWVSGEMETNNTEVEGTFTSQILLSESIYHFGYFLFDMKCMEKTVFSLLGMSSTPTCFCSKNDLFNEDFI